MYIACFQIREKSLKPLRECQNVVAGKITSVDKLVTIGNRGKVCDEELEEFSTISGSLGNLPEVPELKEVPCLSFQCDTTLCTDFMDRIGAFGIVSSIAPVQVTTKILVIFCCFMLGALTNLSLQHNLDKYRKVVS